MRMLGRTAMVLGLACLAQAPSLSAQSIVGFDSFKWYIGGQAGVTIFETPNQTKGGIFTAGGHFLVTARRTGLLFSVEEGFKSNQVSSFLDNSQANGRRRVVFNDIRKYSLSLLVFPFKTIAQPYLGVGVGVLHTVNEYPDRAGVDPTLYSNLDEFADRAGTHTFGSFTGGVQVRVARFAVFGQYQITSGAERGYIDTANNLHPGSLFEGPTHTFTAGLRVSLGSSREDDGSGPSQ